MKTQQCLISVSVFVVALGLLAVGGCKSGTARTNEQETVAGTEANANAQPVSAADTPEVFAEDYKPAAGIRYQSTIIDEGALRLDAEAALKNVRPFQASSLGGELSYRVIGHFEDSHTLTLVPIEEGYLACGLNGLWLLDKEMNLQRMLYRSHIKVEKHGDQQMVSVFQALYHPYYDRSSGLIRFYCREQDALMKKASTSIVTLSKNDLLASTEPLTSADVHSKLPMKGGSWAFSGSFIGMEGGYAMPVRYTNDLLTFSFRGDTLCRFTLGEAVNYTPTGTHRSGEGADAYDTNGQTIIRLAYGNTFYRLKDASTAEAVYTLDFGSLRRVTGPEVVASMQDVDDGYFVSSWLDTDAHLFMKIDRGYDTPNARDSKAVVLHALVYDKQKRDFFSLPLRTDKVAYPAMDGGLKDSFPFWPTHLIDGRPAMLLSASWLKKYYPEQLTRIPALKEIQEGEMILVSIGK